MARRWLIDITNSTELNHMASTTFRTKKRAAFTRYWSHSIICISLYLVYTFSRTPYNASSDDSKLWRPCSKCSKRGGGGGAGWLSFRYISDGSQDRSCLLNAKRNFEETIKLSGLVWYFCKIIRILCIPRKKFN